MSRLTQLQTKYRRSELAGFESLIYTYLVVRFVKSLYHTSARDRTYKIPSKKGFTQINSQIYNGDTKGRCVARR